MRMKTLRPFPSWLAMLLAATLLHPSAIHLRAQNSEAASVTDTAVAQKAEEDTSDQNARGRDTTYNAIVRVGSDAELRVGETAPEMVVVLGNAKIDGDVHGDVVVVRGNVELNGKVDGDLTVVMGSVKLGRKAHVVRDLTVVLGRLDEDPGARIDGDQHHIDPLGLGGRMDPFFQWVKSGLLLGRPIAPTVGWIWWVVALHFLVYFIVALLLPRPVESCVEVLEGSALQAFFLGLLGLVVLGPLLLLLMCSVIGILIVPFVGFGFIAACLVGRTAAFTFIGLQLVKRANPSASPRSLMAFLAGSALVLVLYMVPVIGLVLWGVLLPLSLGSALLAMFRSYRKNNPPAIEQPLPPLAPVGATPGVSTDFTSNPPGPSNPDSASAGTFSAPPPLSSAQIPVQPLPLPRGAAEFAVMPRAGFWVRFAAMALDFVLLGVALHFFGHLWALAWLTYHVGMWTWKGTTIGGVICSLKVIRTDGRDLNFAVALVRALASVFSACALGLGFFWVGWTRERQSWHDLIAGTVIVRVPRGISLL